MHRPPEHAPSMQGVRATTLIEVVIALTIFTVLGVVVVTIYQRTQAASAAHQARASTQTEMTQIVTMLGKDLGVLDHGVVGNPNCNGAELVISTRKGQRRYTSSCAPAPAALAAVDFSGVVSTGCLTGKACPRGQRPILTSLRPVGEPTLVFPSGAFGAGFGVTQRPIGAMACFQITPQAEVTMDLTYFYFEQGQALKIVSRSVTIPTAGIAGTQIIP